MGRMEALGRNKLYWIRKNNLQAVHLPYPRLDLGRLVADELTRNPPGRHVSLDIDDFLRSTLRQACAHQDSSPPGLILENPGILLEPDLALDPVKLFLEISVDAIVILVWDHAILDGIRFVWDEAEPGYGFLFPSHSITCMEIHDEVP